MENYNNICKLILYIIKNGYVDVGTLLQKFGFIDNYDMIINELINDGFMEYEDEYYEYIMIHDSYDSLPEYVKDAINKSDISVDEVKNMFDDNYVYEDSDVLSEGFWTNVNDRYPEVNVPVCIRLKNNNFNKVENNKILCAEDKKIGKWDGEKWSLIPPFPKYDYSPLSNKDKINDDVIVTHWYIPSDIELNGYLNRFKTIDNYDKLKLEIDDEHEEKVYRNLSWAASFMAKERMKYSPEEDVYYLLLDIENTLDDLLSSIDTDIKEIESDGDDL